MFNAIMIILKEYPIFQDLLSQLSDLLLYIIVVQLMIKMFFLKYKC